MCTTPPAPAPAATSVCAHASVCVRACARACGSGDRVSDPLMEQVVPWNISVVCLPGPKKESHKKESHKKRVTDTDPLLLCLVDDVIK